MKMGKIEKKTHKAICNPKPGDRFQEMFSYWMRVEDVLKSEKTGQVMVCILHERQNKRETLALEDYIKKFHYKSDIESLKNKCWIMISERAGKRVDY